MATRRGIGGTVEVGGQDRELRAENWNGLLELETTTVNRDIKLMAKFSRHVCRI